jgi:hypothetical protein
MGPAAVVAVWFATHGDGSATMAAPKAVIQLKCSVLSSEPDSAADFEQKFCRVLADSLTRDLEATFQLTVQSQWKGDGKAVAVNVQMLSNNRANVTMSYGEVSRGIFTLASSSSASLDAVDGPLTPNSSKALIRSIGLETGLLR